MANGVAALHALQPAPKDDPAEAPMKPGEGIEIAIGRATADGVIALTRAIDGYQQTGALPPAAKDAAANGIARIAMLQLDYEAGDDDFIHKARDAGKCELRRYFADFHAHNSPAEVDMILDGLIAELLGIVSMVVKDERALRVAWAH